MRIACLTLAGDDLQGCFGLLDSLLDNEHSLGFERWFAKREVERLRGRERERSRRESVYVCVCVCLCVFVCLCLCL